MEILYQDQVVVLQIHNASRVPLKVQYISPQCQSYNKYYLKFTMSVFIYQLKSYRN